MLTLPMLGAAAAGVGALSLPGAAQAAPVKIPLIWQRQQRNYWCGPAALRIAISAWHDDASDLPSQTSLASYVGTNSGGTNRHQMLSGANHWFGADTYDLEDVESRGGLRSSVALREQFWQRITNGIGAWVPPIVNVVVPAYSPYRPDDWNNSSEVDHWFVIYGYEPGNRIVYIIDPASGLPEFDPDPTYGIRFDYLCQLVKKAYLHF
ncbi:hypothetical protein Aco03nite_085030 [Actinoplanes couchii]|uniref:Peptidase C39-like domain-containing protein n=1 Tax=Actinoplanes couchii TaxID=403638 RepID=A0ABQ3XNK5_9ACTN|nr:hypothetical protein Aco03nite_085030 [Actinoplanes couchii]